MIMALFMQPKLRIVNTNPKLRLQNDVGTKFSWSQMCEKPKLKKPQTEKIYSLFIWGFVLDHKK
jgi:hypothetical protein